MWKRWSRLFKIDRNSLLEPVWRSVRDGFTGKGELDVWLVRESGNLGTSMEAEWATSYS